MCNAAFGGGAAALFKEKCRLRSLLFWDFQSYVFSPDDINFLIEKEKEYPKNIYSVEKTIESIVENKLSCARIGDGEYMIMFKDAPDQATADLQRELLEICKKGSNDNCLVCINPFHLYRTTTQWFCFYYLKFIDKIYKKIKFNSDNFYGDAYCFSHYSIKSIRTQVLNMKKRAEYSYLDIEHIEYIKNLWKNRNVVFVASKESMLNSDPLNVFNEVQSRHFIEVPSVECYREYNEIFDKITKYPKDYLIYLECGFAATVLAYRLSEIGYQALDVGDFYKRITKVSI